MPRMLSTVREVRRANLSGLIDEMGQAVLAEATGIAPSYLWQMGKGEGKSRRGVSDENAELIERKLGKPAGWLSGETTAESQSQTPRLDIEIIYRAMDFLEEMFAARGKQYDRKRYPLLTAAVVEDMMRPESPSVVQLSVKYGKTVDEEHDWSRNKVAGAR